MLLYNIIILVIIFYFLISIKNKYIENFEFIWNNSSRYRPSYDLRGDPNYIYRLIGDHLIPIGHYFIL